MNVPVLINIGFQQRDRQDSQSLNKDTFCRLPFVSAHCIIETKKYPEAGIQLNHDDDDNCPQAYAQNTEAFRALPKNDILQTYVSDDFRSSNVRVDDVGHNFYVFDI